MKQKAIKELRKLIDLSLEIGEKTNHHVSFHLSKSKNVELFDISVYKDSEITSLSVDSVAVAESLTLRNLSECRQRLLKYKEW
ncbi:hypothetical protein Ami103574_02420 [Aminipila butyrica]|uniref:Uncharacterized protein n=1 Tax=Aminipila butyrica TaxID=433296 RepID=A0A858BTY5_9FIRM|nr:hypothetical protein [Aminipila butyrica]QIB68234.1 hypothetical protein Ami103574_02420 [Aminipila butyrica]